MAVTFLVGGARSGKSSLGVRMAEGDGAPVVFIATGEASDEEMAARIARHRAERPAPTGAPLRFRVMWRGRWRGSIRPIL